jgi:hypothetical protein
MADVAADAIPETFTVYDIKIDWSVNRDSEMKINHWHGAVQLNQSLLVLDQIVLDPSVRGRGASRFILDDLMAVNPGIGLVAAYPSPIGFDGSADERSKARQRLARHWQKHGFKRLPRGNGVHVASPDDLRLSG